MESVPKHFKIFSFWLCIVNCVWAQDWTWLDIQNRFTGISWMKPRKSVYFSLYFLDRAFLSIINSPPPSDHWAAPGTSGWTRRPRGDTCRGTSCLRKLSASRSWSHWPMREWVRVNWPIRGQYNYLTAFSLMSAAFLFSVTEVSSTEICLASFSILLW